LTTIGPGAETGWVGEFQNRRGRKERKTKVRQYKKHKSFKTPSKRGKWSRNKGVEPCELTRGRASDKKTPPN